MAKRRMGGRATMGCAVAVLLLATAADADIEATRQQWSALQAQEAAFFSPRRQREAADAMRALETASAGAAADAALAAADKRLQALDAALRRAHDLWHDLLAVREEARAAGAPQVDPRGWKAAENTLFAAAQKLETDRVDAAKRQAAPAQALYEAQRFGAWRAATLQGADSILTRLAVQEAQVYAPRSYVRALDAKSAAEKLLTDRGRPDADVRAAGDRAIAEARHASYLLERIRVSCEQHAADQLENAILEWEESARRALQAMGLTAGFETGLAAPLGVIEQEATRLRSERDRLRVDTTKRAGAGDSLQAALQQLRDELLERNRQVDELKRLEANQDVVTQVQQSFERDEGRVLIDGPDLVLRLHGLQFASGKAAIDPAAEALLGKVVKVVKLVPGARLIIEGHTDAQGTPEANQALSQQRADAVRDYLLEHAGLASSHVTSIGYGASRPVASNDTEEGRALNRRIQIIIARPQ